MFDPGTATKIKAVNNSVKTKQVILFIKGGNATEADSYQVSVKNTGDNLDSHEVGNAFTVDGDHGKTILNSASINFRWSAPDKLTIAYDKKLRTFIQESKVDGVDITYQPR